MLGYIPISDLAISDLEEDQSPNQPQESSDNYPIVDGATTANVVLEHDLNIAIEEDV